MAVALLFILVAVGSVLFHLFSPWWWTPIASNWQLYRQHDHHHLLDHRRRLRRRRPVHGLLRLPLPPPGRADRPLTSRRTRGWSGGSRSRPRWASRPCWRRACSCGSQFVTVPDGAVRVRGRGPAMAVELSAARARTAGSAPPTPDYVSPDNPLGLNPERSERAGRCRDRGRRPAPADRQAGQGAAALDRRPARFLCAGVPRQDGHDPGHRSPTSGSPRPEPAHSRSSAPNSAASATR